MALHGVLGDIHGNVEALAAALARLDACDVDDLLCVGDLVGYNPDGDACVAMLRMREARCIAGNHDLIGTGLLGFERCSNKAMHSLKQTRRTLGDETAAYLRALPSHVALGDVLLTHGGVRDVQQYMTQPRHIADNARLLRADFPAARICFFGHTHEQRVYEVEGDAVHEIALGEGPVHLRDDRIYFVNPGSVDASRKRCVKRAELAVFDDASRDVTFHSVAYDDAATEAKAAAQGYRIERWRDRLYDLQRRVTDRFTL